MPNYPPSSIPSSQHQQASQMMGATHGHLSQPSSTQPLSVGPTIGQGSSPMPPHFPGGPQSQPTTTTMGPQSVGGAPRSQQPAVHAPHSTGGAGGYAGSPAMSQGGGGAQTTTGGPQSVGNSGPGSARGPNTPGQQRSGEFVFDSLRSF